MASEYVEEMVLHILDRDGARAFTEMVRAVQGRLLTEAATESDVFEVMERLRKHGHIAEAGTHDVRGGSLASIEWLITSDGRSRLAALLMPRGTTTVADSVGEVPFASAVLRIGTSLTRAAQRKGLNLPSSKDRTDPEGGDAEVPTK